jgi:hypothetical protein
LVPSETETGNSGDVVLLATLSATTGEASKLFPTDPIITQHQGHVFEDRTRDPQQMDAITQNPKSVPFVTQMPVYTGMSVPAVGQSFEMTVTFSKPVVVTGLPSLRLVLTASPSGATRYATYVGGSGTNTLTFQWAVDVGGITGFEVTQIDQSSGSITSADGSERAESFVPSTTFAMPSYSIAVSPSVIDYTNQNSVILNVANYGSGNMAVVSLNGNALPAVPAAASIPLDVSSLPDGVITVTYYEIANTQTLLSVSATATKDISDTIPPTVTMDAITSPSANTTQTLTGTVSDNLGTPSVQVRLSPSGITQGATVTGTAPNYTWTATVSGLTDATYTVTARATDGMGNITDTSPQTLSINTAAPSATLSTIAGSAYTGTEILTNDATPTLTGTATGGGSASVSQVEISLDGGTTWILATGTTSWSYTPSATLTDTLYNVQVRITNSLSTQSVTPFASAMRVDSAAPSITDVTAPPNGTYGSGQNLDFVATMSEATTVDITNGTPRIALTIGSTTQYATYVPAESTTTALTFRYTVQSGDNDTDGIAVTSPLDLNGGTLRDSASNDATLTFTPPTTTGVLVGIVVTSGLVMNLDAGNSASYPGSGTTWTDLTGNGNNATLINGPTYSSGNGGSIVFDGVDDYVSIGSQNIIGTGTSPFSTEFWIYNTKDFAAGGYSMIYRIKQDTENFLVLYNNAGTWLIWATFRGSNQQALSVTSSDYLNKWVCIDVVYNGGDKNLASSYTYYRNGVSLGSGTTNLGVAGGTGNNCNILGRDGDGSTPCNVSSTGQLQGNLAAFKVYNRALSAAEIKQNFNAQNDRFGLADIP